MIVKVSRNVIFYSEERSHCQIRQGFFFFISCQRAWILSFEKLECLAGLISRTLYDMSIVGPQELFMLSV
ncbi:hypothetical protein CICLE_v10026899mg [Citrus x clementina]|uniref:Uncharacterized protein n=1 Tax=Citrus clementina TaxID=85681 RepID=V4SIM1_CITCL|nr:hypothetical protein CICLE_v10026899mg [Citrus x clementina]